MRAQEGQAVVKAASLPVYAAADASSSLVTTLAPGSAVRILFSITNGDSSWCGVSEENRAERLGFVRCDGLKRSGGANGTAASSKEPNADATFTFAGTASGPCGVFQSAVAHGQVAEVEQILQSEPGLLDCEDLRGWTALHRAAASGSVEMAPLLLDYGALVDARNAQGFTPLHTAAASNRAEVAEVLINHGAALNAPSDAGDTPLHWAAGHNAIDVAELLLKQGADVNAKDKDGATPLHMAAARGDSAMIELLIARGANLRAKTRLGSKPLRTAYDNNQMAAAQALLQHKAPL